MSKIENYCHHDGEQSDFHKKIHIDKKERCSCNLYIVARNEEFQFIWQKLYSRER